MITPGGVESAIRETGRLVPRPPRVSPRALKRPDLQLAIGINKRVVLSDEWFDEPDELDRVDIALLLARWILDSNGIAGRRILDPDDRELAFLSGRHLGRR